ncbi:MAG: PUR family DNA/RNA-binding protein [Bacteroidetes bacterium]|nr:PUR family DNA/RNA-binding protein [Bacteroidota bacterium]
MTQDDAIKNEDGLYSKSVRAGKRTYFFDVRATRAGDCYLTITESKKRFLEDGKFVFEKHKIFLYKEDFEKFTESFNDAINFIKKNAPATPEADGSSVNFDDLGS